MRTVVGARINMNVRVAAARFELDFCFEIHALLCDDYRMAKEGGAMPSFGIR
jgi:hypothetical protein